MKTLLTFLLAALLSLPALAEETLFVPIAQLQEDGRTTLFAVQNASSAPVDVQVTTYDWLGNPLSTITRGLGPMDTFTENIALWAESVPACPHLVPDLRLYDPLNLDANGEFGGYIEIRPVAPGQPCEFGPQVPTIDSPLVGDWFLADPVGNFAEGDSLVKSGDLTTGPQGLRYARPGNVPFDNTTHFIFSPGGAGTIVDVQILDEDGFPGAPVFFTQIGVPDAALIPIEFLQPEAPFGTVVYECARPCWVGGRLQASGRFSVPTPRMLYPED